MPSLTSRTITAKKIAKPLSKAEKTRLRRIARKEMPGGEEHVGAADVALDATHPLEDAWDSAPTAVAVAEGDFGSEGMIKRTVKAPKTLAEQRRLRQGRLENGLQLLDELPDAGTSYNPSAESHAALMERAVQEELALLKKEAEQEEQIRELGEVVVSRKAAREAVDQPGEYAEGMKVDTLSDDESEAGDNTEGAAGTGAKKATVRKTQAQRNKVLRRKLAAQELERETRMRNIHKQLGASAVAQIKKQAEARLKEMQEKERLAKLLRKEKERLGHEGGEKIGRFKVGKKRVDVQLGEDLAESLRQVKVSHSSSTASEIPKRALS